MKHPLTTAVLAAVAAALTACGGGHDTAATTTTVTAAPTTTTPAVSAADIPAPAAAPSVPVWRPGTVHPGSRIVSGDSGDSCTAGWIFRDPSGVAVALTAEHCRPGAAVTTEVVTAPGGPGEVGMWLDQPGDLGDVAAVRLALIDQGLVDAGPTPVVMPAAEVAKLPRGVQVCATLARGAVCGKVDSINNNATGLYAAFDAAGAPKHSDSGAPVWTLDRDGHTVAVGIIARTTGGGLVRVAYIAPAVAAFNLS